MVCIADDAFAGTVSDTHTVISITRCTIIRVACATDTPPERSRRDPRHLVPQRRLALPLAAASLALAALPLLRRLPNRVLEPGSFIRERTLLPGITEQTARMRHAPQPRRLDAGSSALAAGRDGTSRPDGATWLVAVIEVDDAQLRPEREPELVAGPPS